MTAMNTTGPARRGTTPTRPARRHRPSTDEREREPGASAPPQGGGGTRGRFRAGCRRAARHRRSARRARVVNCCHDQAGLGTPREAAGRRSRVAFGTRHDADDHRVARGAPRRRRHRSARGGERLVVGRRRALHVRICAGAGDDRERTHCAGTGRTAARRERAAPATCSGSRSRSARLPWFEMSLITAETVVTHQVPAMGTTAELMIVGAAGPALVQWALERLVELESSWSRFRAESELRGLDGRAGAGAIPASPDLVDAVGRALSLWHVTGGLFDPTVRRALESLGYDRTFRDVAPDGPALFDARNPAPGCDGVRVDRERSTISLPGGVLLDLGGVGEGLAADLVATGLVERGAIGACVGLGGDVRASGSSPDGDAWRIRVENPVDESHTLCTRALRDAAIVTSTTRFRCWNRGTRSLHHIIDPATGAPADRGVAAVVAQADEAWWAEGIAKAALVAGVERGLALLERLGLPAVIVGVDGTHHRTSDWEPA
jgi:FAD:protein FMN transferase